jgi:hypothetical protein
VDGDLPDVLDPEIVPRQGKTRDQFVFLGESGVRTVSIGPAPIGPAPIDPGGIERV